MTHDAQNRAAQSRHLGERGSVLKVHLPKLSNHTPGHVGTTPSKFSHFVQKRTWARIVERFQGYCAPLKQGKGVGGDETLSQGLQAETASGGGTRYTGF